MEWIRGSGINKVGGKGDDDDDQWIDPRMSVGKGFPSTEVTARFSAFGVVAQGFRFCTAVGGRRTWRFRGCGRASRW